jgi:acyl-CoA synthetase (AMP-forming)/AMP-acid ligase II
MAGAVLNCINIRLDARTVAFQLRHAGSKAILVDQEFFNLVGDALQILKQSQGSSYHPPLLVVIEDKACPRASLEAALSNGACSYEELLQLGDPSSFRWNPPDDEWSTISLSYTSGTTSDPKGVVSSHRGAYLASLSGCLVWGLKDGCVYLWTLPLFHCNGWCYSWGIAAVAGTNVCLRQVRIVF